MRIMTTREATQDDFPRYKIERKWATELIERSKYGSQDYGSHRSLNIEAAYQLGRISYLSGRDLRGKKILDLGCGSSEDIDYKEIIIPPLLCRILKEQGALVVGIDIGDNTGEEFEHYKKDLSEHRALNFLGDNSIDIANARNLFDSENLLLSQGISGKELWEVLIPQLERVVKPTGYFVYEEFFDAGDED